MLNRTISIAPMMGWTDRHARYFLRLITRHSLLYTEMVTTGAILHGKRDDLLRYHPAEHPLAIQLGGSVPAELAECSRIVEQLGFDEINLNVGCPSDRVQSGTFGACMMAQPELVSECISAMNSVVGIPVTVKCRIGIDEMESFEAFEKFILTVAASGCDTFIIHARKAWLKGLSPKQNRDVPPLKYDYVYQLKRSRPELTIVVNGGIKTRQEIDNHLEHVDAVMLGREAYHNPFMLAEMDKLYYADQASEPNRKQVIAELQRYIDLEMQSGTRLHSITRHIHGLYHGRDGAKRWRRMLGKDTYMDGAGSHLLSFELDS